MPKTSGLSGEICFKQESMTDSTPAQMATGFCSTQAGLGNVISTGTEARAKILLSRSTTIALVLVVPWSIARIRSGMGKKCGMRIANCGMREPRTKIGRDRRHVLPTSFAVYSPTDKSTVHDQINTGTKGSGSAEQEDGRSDQFIYRGHSSERGIRFKLFTLFGHLRSNIHWCKGVARADGINPNSPVCPLHRQALGQMHYRGL